MKEPDPELLEAELKRLRPAQPSGVLLARLTEIRPAATVRAEGGSHVATQVRALWHRLWWPAAAVTSIILLALALLSRQAAPPAPKRYNPPLATDARPALNADEVEIDQQLMSVFDAVARLPSGEPVRFHCRQWLDEVVLRDSVRGVVIERQTPRLEVVPVSFETY